MKPFTITGVIPAFVTVQAESKEEAYELFRADPRSFKVEVNGDAKDFEIDKEAENLFED